MLPNQPKISTAGTLFGKIFGQPLHVEDMPESETTPKMAHLRQKVIVVGNSFTTFVDLIRRTPFLSERVRNLGKLIWGLVGNRVIPACIGPTPTGTISFVGEGRGGDFEKKTIEKGRYACFMVPDTWLDQLLQDPIMQFGGVVCTSSQARDYYNGRLSVDSLKRAYAFEAEALFGVQKVESEWQPNEYQCQIMKEYPEGTLSLPPHLWYESKPFVDPRPGETI